MAFFSDPKAMIAAQQKMLIQIDGILSPLDLSGVEMSLMLVIDEPVLNFYLTKDIAPSNAELAKALCGEFEEAAIYERYHTIKGHLKLLPAARVYINTPL